MIFQLTVGAFCPAQRHVQIPHAHLLVVLDAELLEPNGVVAPRPVLAPRLRRALPVGLVPPGGPEEAEPQLSDALQFQPLQTLDSGLAELQTQRGGETDAGEVFLGSGSRLLDAEHGVADRNAALVRSQYFG